MTLEKTSRFFKAISRPSVWWMGGNAAAYGALPWYLGVMNGLQTGLTAVAEVANEFEKDGGRLAKACGYLARKVNGYTTAAVCTGVDGALSMGRYYGYMGGKKGSFDHPGHMALYGGILFLLYVSFGLNERAKKEPSHYLNRHHHVKNLLANPGVYIAGLLPAFYLKPWEKVGELLGSVPAEHMAMYGLSGAIVALAIANGYTNKAKNFLTDHLGIMSMTVANAGMACLGASNHMPWYFWAATGAFIGGNTIFLREQWRNRKGRPAESLSKAGYE